MKMTILLYDYHDLEERASNHLKVWKAWHTILYILAALFGILNYTFLQSTMQLVDNNCVIYPRKLEFHWVKFPEAVATDNNVNYTRTLPTNTPTDISNVTEVNITTNAQPVVVPSENGTVEKIAKTVKKRYAPTNVEIVSSTVETTVEETNATIITENTTHRLVLDVPRSLFASESTCQFAEYMPIMSTIAAILWATLFIMCPGGGRSRTGLPQPWRILTPALLFALVLVGLTGHSFASTNGGLQAFCAAFYNVSNATTCSSVSPFLEAAWFTSWGMGGRAAATRAAAAGAWASWACAAALLLARCLTAPDFAVRRTGAYLTNDPQQKVLPYLKTSPRHSQRSAHTSPSKRDTVSVKSEPTTFTELVTASVEQDPDSEPTSLVETPVRKERQGEDIEMTDHPDEFSVAR